MRRPPWLCTAITVAVCLAPPVAEGQVTAPPTRNATRVLSLQTINPGTLVYPINERIYRERLSDALGDRLDFHSDTLDVVYFPDPLYRITVRRPSRAEVSRPADRPAAGKWRHRGRYCGTLASTARVPPCNRIHWHLRTARSEIDRPHVYGCDDERVARTRAARASRHTSRVSRVRDITATMPASKPDFAPRCRRRPMALSSLICVGSLCPR